MRDAEDVLDLLEDATGYHDGLDLFIRVKKLSSHTADVTFWDPVVMDEVTFRVDVMRQP